MFLFAHKTKTPISTYTESYRPPQSMMHNYKEPLSNTWKKNEFITEVNSHVKGCSSRVRAHRSFAGPRGGRMGAGKGGWHVEDCWEGVYAAWGAKAGGPAGRDWDSGTSGHASKSPSQGGRGGVGAAVVLNKHNTGIIPPARFRARL